ncbi:MAG: Crp/Fnr family transcriptional regulator [Actinobacteria bacterium]|nr:Crp/Fnr family transcriptional regulator [Actinomycetota bacterium]
MPASRSSPTQPHQAAAFLAATPLFLELPEPELSHVAERTVERSYERGEALFHQGDPGDSLFVLVSGLVKVYVTSERGDEMVLATLRPPDSFGELALIDGDPRSASIRALEPTVALTLGRAALLDLLQKEAHVASALLRSVGSLVRELIEQAGDLVFLDLQGRVAKLLVGMAAERGTTRDDAVVLDLAMTQADLAAMVGGSRQSVNQILHALEGRGYLELHGREVVLKDVEALRRRSGAPE